MVAFEARRWQEGFTRFRELYENESKKPFRGFNEGLIAAWEDYKPKVREKALALLRTSEWSEAEIGSGSIVEAAIAAVEIAKTSSNLLENNLVLWDARHGPQNREHKLLIDALTNKGLCFQVERLLFGLFRANANEGTTFDTLSSLSGGKYSFLAYLYFLKDMNRFAPIKVQKFDAAFRELGIDLKTQGRCSWENYASFNESLAALRPRIETAANVKKVRLIDAHSLCWVLINLIEKEAAGTLGKQALGKSSGSVWGPLDHAIERMCRNAESAVKQSGQPQVTTPKLKLLKMPKEELRKTIAGLIEQQGGCCKLTGLSFQVGEGTDPSYEPSLDRIDSSGHYEHGNLQVVCRFVNFWKGETDNEVFKALLAAVRT